MQRIKADYDWDTGLYTYNCNRVSNLNDINFYLRTDRRDGITIPSREYVVDIGLNDGKCALALGMHDGSFYKEDFVGGTLFVRECCFVYDFEYNTLQIYLTNDQ